MPTAETATYRVTSISEAGNGYITVNFVEVRENVATEPGVPQSPYSNFSKVFLAEDAAGYFPGQVYTMSLTPES